jgi:hypothetical protein
MLFGNGERTFGIEKVLPDDQNRFLLIEVLGSGIRMGCKHAGSGASTLRV